MQGPRNISPTAERRLIAPWRTVDGRADCKWRSSEAHIEQEQGASRPPFGSLKVARRGLVGCIEGVGISATRTEVPFAPKPAFFDNSIMPFAPRVQLLGAFRW